MKTQEHVDAVNDFIAKEQAGIESGEYKTSGPYSRAYMLTPVKLFEAIPGLKEHEGEEVVLFAKFFLPETRWTWYVSEWFEDEDRIKFFGFVVSGMGEGLGYDEWGYFDLEELKAIKSPALGLPVERDLYFTPRLATKIPEISTHEADPPSTVKVNYYTQMETQVLYTEIRRLDDELGKDPPSARVDEIQEKLDDISEVIRDRRRHGDPFVEFLWPDQDIERESIGSAYDQHHLDVMLDSKDKNEHAFRLAQELTHLIGDVYPVTDTNEPEFVMTLYEFITGHMVGAPYILDGKAGWAIYERWGAKSWQEFVDMKKSRGQEQEESKKEGEPPSSLVVEKAWGRESLVYEYDKIQEAYPDAMLMLEYGDGIYYVMGMDNAVNLTAAYELEKNMDIHADALVEDRSGELTQQYVVAVDDPTARAQALAEAGIKCVIAGASSETTFPAAQEKADTEPEPKPEEPPEPAAEIASDDEYDGWDLWFWGNPKGAKRKVKECTSLPVLRRALQDPQVYDETIGAIMKRIKKLEK